MKRWQSTRAASCRHAHNLGKIPPEGYWQVTAILRGEMQILGSNDIDAAEKKVRKSRPFNQWKETALHLWRKGEI
ncbi:MAG: hypothetical protein PHY05_10050 [Methanothrix sp.]|nr:hypothetical protein [Methanothrix sp.]